MIIHLTREREREREVSPKWNILKNVSKSIGGMSGVIFIVVGNRLGKLNSNHKQGCLHFMLMSLEEV